MVPPVGEGNVKGRTYGGEEGEKNVGFQTNTRHRWKKGEGQSGKGGFSGNNVASKKHSMRGQGGTEVERDRTGFNKAGAHFNQIWSLGNVGGSGKVQGKREILNCGEHFWKERFLTGRVEGKGGDMTVPNRRVCQRIKMLSGGRWGKKKSDEVRKLGDVQKITPAKKKNTLLTGRRKERYRG